jgi:thiamine biosynthesis protein ThiS
MGRLDPSPARVHNGAVRIKINGQWAEHSDGLTVTGLLEILELDARRVAVERNTAIVRRKTFNETTLADNDELEIVTLVGGG